MSEKKYTQKEYSDLKTKYEKLQKQYLKLNSRVDTMIKMHDENMKSLFDKQISSERANKRLKTIMKQSDNQSLRLVKENDYNQELLLKQSKIASADEIIEDLSYQIKKPLSLILTSSTSLELENEMQTLDDEKFKIYTENITQASQHLSDIIDEVKHFFQDDKILQKFSLTTIIVKAKRQLEKEFRGQKIKIVHELNDHIISGIESELVQVVSNLMSNSINALKNQKDKKFIFISSSIENNNAVIEFKDNAKGIDENVINSVFESYYDNKDKGCDIGLHMSKLIIEKTFNGTIDVSNEKFTYKNIEYAGAHFKIVLDIN